MVELWQAEEGELLLPAQVRGSGGGCGVAAGAGRGGVAAGPDCQAASMFPGAASPARLPPLALVGRLLLACAFSFCEIFFYFFLIVKPERACPNVPLRGKCRMFTR